MGTVDVGRHGAFSRADAIARYGAYEVRRAQESGRWSAPWSGVLVVNTRAAHPLTLASAAVILAGPGCVLGGPTAARIHGCLAAEPVPVHLVTPHGHWLRSRPGLAVHNGPLPDTDQTIVDGLPVLTLERTLTDVLCDWRRPQDGLAIVDEALRMAGPERSEQLRARIDERIGRRTEPRGTRLGQQLLGLATGRAESPAESWLLWRIVDSGFPVPEVNWSLMGPNGREVHRLDFSWPDLRIVVEYQGYAAHDEREVEDAARADSLRRRGWLLVEVRAEDLANPARFERELDRAFRRRGVDTSRRNSGALRARRHREPGSSRSRTA